MADAAWYEARIVAAKAQIIAYEAAIVAVSGGAQMYSLDSGQTRQMVTKASLVHLQNGLQAAENRLATLEARLCGASAVSRPGWG